MKVAIIGSRNITSFNLTPHIPEDVTQIVSGGAVGIDTLARNYAISHGIELLEFLPEYEKYGRSAPIIRNKKIIEASDIILAIWDGKSRGTLFSINNAKQRGKKVIVVYV